MTFSVRFSRQARDPLLALDDYIADASSPDFAVDPDARSVVILAIYQAGRDYEDLLRAADFPD